MQASKGTEPIPRDHRKSFLCVDRKNSRLRSPGYSSKPPNQNTRMAWAQDRKGKALNYGPDTKQLSSCLFPEAKRLWTSKCSLFPAGLYLYFVYIECCLPGASQKCCFGLFLVRLICPRDLRSSTQMLSDSRSPQSSRHWLVVCKETG